MACAIFFLVSFVLSIFVLVGTGLAFRNDINQLAAKITLSIAGFAAFVCLVIFVVLAGIIANKFHIALRGKAKGREPESAIIRNATGNAIRSLQPGQSLSL